MHAPPPRGREYRILFPVDPFHRSHLPTFPITYTVQATRIAPSSTVPFPQDASPRADASKTRTIAYYDPQRNVPDDLVANHDQRAGSLEASP